MVASKFYLLFAAHFAYILTATAAGPNDTIVCMFASLARTFHSLQH